ncbi:MAG: hypothetical protein AAF617_14390 [Bacteroidota bacterium]
MKKLLFFIFVSFNFQVFCQNFDAINAETIAEATELYESQMIALKAAELYFKKYRNQAAIGGYLAYSQDSISKCIFYSKAENATVIAEITLDTSYKLIKEGINVTERAFTPYEKDLYEIRSKSQQRITTDTLFKSFQDSQFKILPLIYKGKKKAYIVTNSLESEIVIFGNDYRIDFDKDNTILHVTRLHKDITPIKYPNNSKESNAIHTHSLIDDDLMTVTDVFTLLLHWERAKWETHMVVSQNYLSVLHLRSKRLITMTQEAYKKMIDRIDKGIEKQKQKENNQKN